MKEGLLRIEPNTFDWDVFQNIDITVTELEEKLFLLFLFKVVFVINSCFLVVNLLFNLSIITASSSYTVSSLHNPLGPSHMINDALNSQSTSSSNASRSDVLESDKYEMVLDKSNIILLGSTGSGERCFFITTLM